MKDQYDCVVIGNGLMGNAIALRVAAAGFDTLLLERECQNPVSRQFPLSLAPPAQLERMPITQIGRVMIENSGVITISGQSSDRLTPIIGAKVAIKSTRRPELLGDHLTLRKEVCETKQAAIWAHYRNVRRESGERCESTLLLPTSKKNSCFWFAPLPNNLTSIGVVGSRAYLLNGRGRAAQVFEDELVQCPTIADRLMNATLVGELHSVSHFARGFTPLVGDGWLVLCDPVEYEVTADSAESCFAQCLGESAAESIIAGLRAGDLSARQLGQWMEAARIGSPWVVSEDNPAGSHDVAAPTS